MYIANAVEFLTFGPVSHLTIQQIRSRKEHKGTLSLSIYSQSYYEEFPLEFVCSSTHSDTDTS